jgi:hypothetical protein
MYQYILSMYWYEHFRGFSSRVSGFQMLCLLLACLQLCGAAAARRYAQTRIYSTE